MMKKGITIYGNHRFFIDVMRDFLEKHEIAKADTVQIFSTTEELKRAKFDRTGILIMNLTGENIMEVTDYIEKWLSLNKDLKIMVLSNNTNMKTIKRLFDKGIKAYLGKNTSTDEFLNSLQTIKNGLVYINDDTKNDLFNYICTVGDPDKEKAVRIDDLTTRELDVLGLICEGMRTREIAEKLFISIHTVESHRRNIMLKLNINNASRLVKYAIDHHLVK